VRPELPHQIRRSARPRKLVRWLAGWQIKNIRLPGIAMARGARSVRELWPFGMVQRAGEWPATAAELPGSSGLSGAGTSGHATPSGGSRTTLPSRP
jgi:hypothetical protein